MPYPNVNYPDFVTMMIACTLLTSEYYKADKLTVFNMIIVFITGKLSSNWVKVTCQYVDGRWLLKAPCTHFVGGGNATRDIFEADQLKESFLYKSKKVLVFDTFLTQCQKMYLIIYKKESKTMTKEAKIFFLCKGPSADEKTEKVKNRRSTKQNRVAIRDNHKSANQPVNKI